MQNQKFANEATYSQEGSSLNNPSIYLSGYAINPNQNVNQSLQILKQKNKLGNLDVIDENSNAFSTRRDSDQIRGMTAQQFKPKMQNDKTMNQLYNSNSSQRQQRQTTTNMKNRKVLQESQNNNQTRQPQNMSIVLIQNHQLNQHTPTQAEDLRGVSNRQESKVHSLQSTQVTKKKNGARENNNQIKTIVESVLTNLQQQTCGAKPNKQKQQSKSKNKKSFIERSEIEHSQQSLTDQIQLSSFQNQPKESLIKASNHHLRKSSFTEGNKFANQLQQFTQAGKIISNISNEMILRPQTSHQKVDAISQNVQIKRSHTPNNLNAKTKSQAPSDLGKFINNTINPNKLERLSQQQAHNQHQMTRQTSQSELSKSQSKSNLNLQAPKTPKNSANLKLHVSLAKSATNIKKQQQKSSNKNRTDKSLQKLNQSSCVLQQQQQKVIEQSIQQMPQEIKQKSKAEIRAFLIKTLPAVIMGFKVRRIIRNNKQVNMLKAEHNDLMRFIFELKIELGEQIKSNNRQAFSTKQLLIQSIKDLSKKKDQFYQTYIEIYNHQHWIKISKPLPIQQDQKRLSNQKQAIEQVGYNTVKSFTNTKLNDSINTQNNNTQQKQQQNSHFSLISESELKNGRNNQIRNFSQNRSEVPAQQYQKIIIKDVSKDQQLSFDHTLKNHNDTKIKSKLGNYTELQRYLTGSQKINEEELQSQESSEYDLKNGSLSQRKQYLKKGIQSRKYDPKLAIKEQKEKKKQQENEKIEEQKRQQELLEQQKLLKQQKPISSFMNVRTSAQSSLQPGQQQQQQSLFQKHQQLNTQESYDQKATDVTADSIIPQPQILSTEPVETTEQMNRENSQQRFQRQFSSKIPKISTKRDESNSSLYRINLRNSTSIASLTHDDKKTAPQEQNNIKIERQNQRNQNQSQHKEIPTLKSQIIEQVKNQVQATQAQLSNNNSLELSCLSERRSSQIIKRNRGSRETRSSLSQQQLIDLKSQTIKTRQSIDQSTSGSTKFLPSEAKNKDLNQSSDQLHQLISELQQADLNKDAKVKTLETLTAITGMLQSLRNNQLIDKDVPQAKRRDEKNYRIGEGNNNNNEKLKHTFQSLVQNLQNEFNMLLETRERR
ncbi:UNKNOWN [Stylonychia lemnae]|uniref:Uncharacterized protein n=1 Tax=Stylonychia lemnae TaxID=5949 RepID=A0A077ZXW8_STYLE|nr:UNKNOWN [Stylonychia lemnae]|eukprot:CDW73376.1 UNKNOWN [Stylonychia lemnae]